MACITGENSLNECVRAELYELLYYKKSIAKLITACIMVGELRLRLELNYYYRLTEPECCIQLWSLHLRITV